MERRITRAIKSLPDIELDADASPAERKLEELRGRLAELSDKKVGVDLDATEARRQIAALKDDLQELARRSPSVSVSVDAARASTELAQVEREVDKLDGRNAKIDVNVGGNASLMLSAISAGALGVGAALAPAAALLATLPALGAGAAAGFGAIYAGFQGVGDGVKALDLAEKQQAATADQSAARQVAAAASIANAQDGVRNSVRGVEDAQRAAGIANENAAAAVRNALDGQTRAEQTLAAAQRQELAAQETLTEARKAAQRQLEDLQMQTQDGALAERHALLNVEQAKADLDKALANPLATDLQRRQAQLAYDESVQHLSDQRLQNKQLAEDKAAADTAGIEGSRQVMSAQKGVALATDSVANAQRGLQQAQEQVAQAQRQQTETQRQGLENVTKAQEQVLAATRALDTALASAGAQGTNSVNALQYAMDQLSPSAQHFAHFLHDEVLPGLKGIRDSVQAALLPQLETSMRNLGSLGPIITTGLTQTATVIGDLAVKGSAMVTSGPWKADFAQIMAANNVSLGKFGDAGLSVMDMMRNLAVASLPLIDRIATLTQRMAAQGAAWLQSKRDSGELAVFFKNAGDALMTILDAAGKVAVAAIRLGQSLAPLGMFLVPLAGDLAQFVGWLSKASPLLADVVAVAIGLAPVFGRVSGAVDGLSKAFQFLYGGGLTQKLEGWALSAGAVTEKTVGLAASSETAAAAGARVSSAGEKAAGAIGKMGAALPIAGAALIALDAIWQSTVTSTDEGAAAFLKGGAAAEQMKAKVDDELTGFGKWLNNMTHFVATSDDMAAAMHKQLDAMDPLARAQALAKQAQNDYLNALSKGPAGAAAAADAQRRYGAATGEVTRQEDLLKRGLESATDAMNRQRDAMLGTMNADIRYQSSLAAVTESVKQNGVGFDIATEAGRRNKQALLDVSQAALDDIAAMTQQGISQDEIRAKETEYRDALINSAMQIGMTRDQATAYVDQLHLIPPAVGTVATLDTGPADRALSAWINSAEARPIVLRATTVAATIAGDLGRVAGGIDVRPMAAGGLRSMASGVATVVPANTPTLIGDHPSSPEAYIPLDRSPRSNRIFDVAASALGRRVVPMAAGGALATDGTPGPGDLFGDLTSSARTLTQAGLGPLADALTRTVVPALATTQQAAGQDTPTAIRLLTTVTTASTGAMGGAWADLGRTLTGVANGMSQAMLGWQNTHDAAWADMRARSGAAIGEITGAQFGALHGGLDAVGGHATRTADWWGGQLGRLVPLTGDPVRWSLQYPVNAGLVQAWNAIDKFFALNRPMGPVPIGFAAGSEDHRAQIADPGTPRLWNEPETGGEAYIPLSPAKRTGSLSILDRVAKRFDRALVPSFADGGIVEPYLADTRRMIGDIQRFHGTGNYPATMTAASNNAVAGAADTANRAIAAAQAAASAGGILGSGGMGVERWRDVGIRALGIAGQPASKWPLMAMQMGSESGGNPTVVNTWDSNWQAGHPSVGLLQLINSTYARWKVPQYDVGPYSYGVSVDPLANLIAGTRYTVGQYGSLEAGWHGHGYDTGGDWPNGTWGFNASGHTERVLTGEERSAFLQLVETLTTHRTTGPLAINTSQLTQLLGQSGGGGDPGQWGPVITQAVGRAVSDALNGAGLRIVDDGRNGMARIEKRQRAGMDRRG